MALVFTDSEPLEWRFRRIASKKSNVPDVNSSAPGKTKK